MIAWVDRQAKRFMWIAHGLVFATAASVIWFAFDREPPFAVLSVEPAEAKAGEVVVIRANVRRDPERDCSAEMTRYVFDATGARFDSSKSFVSAEMIAMMERQAPGRLSVAFTIPQGAAPGPAALTSALLYRCNKVHHLWPIEVTTVLPFTILP